jgi:hypothetical protein
MPHLTHLILEFLEAIRMTILWKLIWTPGQENSIDAFWCGGNVHMALPTSPCVAPEAFYYLQLLHSRAADAPDPLVFPYLQ